MTTDRIEPGQIRERIQALLAELPDDGETGIDEVARRLAAAHDMLVDALESVEKG